MTRSMHHPRSTPRRGIALLLVLITMAAATTLVMGWLAVQDTSPLVGRNAVRTAEARIAALAGLELAVAVMETDAPWRTQHADGWVLKNHDLAGASVSVRLWDALADPAMPPNAGTTSVRVEASAVIDGMTQTATAQATVHPFDGESLGDLDGLALFADEALRLSGTTRIRGWRHASSRRLLGIGSSAPGSVVLHGAAIRHGTAGADLVLPQSAGPNVLTGSGRGGLTRNQRQRPLPDMLGLFGLQRSSLPTPPLAGPTGESLELDDPGEVLLGDVSDLLIDGDLHVGEDVELVLPAGETVIVLGDLTLEPDATVRAAHGGSATLIVVGNLEVDHATLGTVTPSRRRNSRPRTAVAAALHLIAGGGSNAEWSITDQSLVAARIDAPMADVIIERSVIVGRIAAHSIDLEHTRLWYDGSLATGAGLGALVRTVDHMDLLDRRTGGLEAPARAAVLERLVALTDSANVRTSHPASPPNGEAWLLRPVLVEAQMDQFGGDTDVWEAAALANAGEGF